MKWIPRCCASWRSPSDCRVHVDSDPSLPRDVWFEEWRDGRHAFADFVEHTLVAGAN